MSGWTEHLVAVPVVLPLAAGALMLLFDEGRQSLKAAIGITATLLLVAAAIALLRLVDAPATHVYRLGGWPAPFGIVLVADRLSALLVLLASVLGLAALLFSLARWHRAGPRFHPLIQFLMMGVNGAFLTGDLFNLFVFFEVFLAASYGLALHGSGPARVRESLHYIAVNGRTFRYTDKGPEGLAGGKRVIVAVSRGGYYDLDNAFEHVESYLKPFFNFIGIEPEFVRANGVNVARDEGIAGGLAEVEALAA